MTGHRRWKRRDRAVMLFARIRLHLLTFDEKERVFLSGASRDVTKP